MRDFLLDLRYAARTLRLNPGFATVAIVTLALGIGGTTAIFSVLDPVLIRPLAYAEPERLVSVMTYFPSMKLETLVSADFAAFEQQNHVFTSMAAYPHGLDTMKLDTPGGPLRAAVTRVTPSFFSMLGVQPMVGRAFLERESRPTAANVAIITFGLWQRAFKGEPGTIGRAVKLDEEPYTLVGILPPSFRFPEEEKVDLFTPLPLDDTRLQHGKDMRTWRGIARLRPGVSVAQAQADLETIFAGIRAQYKWFYRSDVQLRVVPLHLHQVREVRLSLLILAGAVGFVLLIACANVAHVMLARAAGRAREIAVRAALGAGKMRLVRQLFTESALVGVLGGAMGALLAFVGLGAARNLLPQDIPHIDQVAVDLRALAFAGVVSIAASLLFGLAPVLAALRTDLIETLKLGGGAGRGARHSLRGALLAGEIAFSLVLLAGAALLMESLWRLENVPLGFQPEHVVVASIPLQGTSYQNRSQQGEFLRRALERALQLPGVTAAAVADALPPEGNGGTQTFTREDQPLPEPGHRGDNMIRRGITEDYFRAMGIPLLRGRAFTARDTADGPEVMIVNQALVRRYFPNEDALGKRIGGIQPDLKWKTIVGVVGDGKNQGLQSDPQPEAYSPTTQEDGQIVPVLIVRTTAEPQNMIAALRAELRDLDKTLPVTVQTMPDQLAELLARPRFQTIMMAIFSALALAMAAVGVYGVASWSVAQRTREIGVRMALGAAPGDVLRMVLRGALGPLCLGVVIGTAGALATTRYLQSLLFGVKPNDAATLAAAGSILAAAALAATYIPARRAARANPAVTLRSE
jgi:putative ABC transport system permease protein